MTDQTNSALLQLQTSSKLPPLNIFPDADEILWVSGRLSKQETLSFYSKHPVFIIKSPPLAESIIQYLNSILCMRVFIKFSPLCVKMFGFQMAYYS